jgi:hypothetical protein
LKWRVGFSAFRLYQGNSESPGKKIPGQAAAHGTAADDPDGFVFSVLPVHLHSPSELPGSGKK